MSYSITINYKNIGADTSFLPEDYIVAAETNPGVINEGDTVTLSLKADGVYFAFPSRSVVSATGANVSWIRSENEVIITVFEAISDVIIEVKVTVVTAPQLVNKPLLYQIKAPVDTRLVLTKKEMHNAKDEYLPDTYFASCIDDGHFYVYNKSNEKIPETGKYRRLMATEGATDLDLLDPDEIRDLLDSLDLLD